MAGLDLEMLARVADTFVARRAAHLSPGERRELFAIAQAMSCKDSANALGICYETVRARRKRIYRKLGLAGAGELTSALLRMSLELLDGGLASADPGIEAPPPQRETAPGRVDVMS